MSLLLLFQGSGAAAAADETDTHDPGPLSRGERDRIRRRIREAEKAQETNRQERERSKRRLAEELDRAYRRVVLGEPDVALEIAEAIAPQAVAEAEPNELPDINWRALTDILDTAEQVLAILERDRSLAAWLAADDEDIEILLLS